MKKLEEKYQKNSLMKLELQSSYLFFTPESMVDKILHEVSDSFSLTGLFGGMKKINFSGVLPSVSWTEVDCIVPNGVVLLKGQLNIFFANRFALGC